MRSLAIDTGCNVKIINQAGKGIIENFRSDDFFEIILSHIDKFLKRTLHIDFCNYQTAFFLFDLYELGFSIQMNKKHVIINSYIEDYKDILLILNYVSDIHDVKFYNNKRIPMYKGINKEIVKWMIRNDFLVDLKKTEGDKKHKELVAYKTRREQKEFSTALKSRRGKPGIAKNGGRL
ncbi:hypothetical protein [Raoultella ornithinolytica]|uniref:hypothetical protein n=1 Tax=Raoultella ornithinolytica TaxID=54291 RepID=UPI002A4D4DC8|nr:hypothetical protein [Raoultella ornithinolytica]